jgi:hypothetical protein
VRSSQATLSASRWLVGSSSSSMSGLAEQQAAQRHAARSPPESLVDVGVRRRAAQRVHRDLDGAVEVPAVAGVDLLLQLGLLLHQLVHLGVGSCPRPSSSRLPRSGDELADVATPSSTLPSTSLAVVELRLLRQVADLQARARAQASPTNLCRRPAMILSSVLLPAPLRPRTPILAPAEVLHHECVLGCHGAAVYSGASTAQPAPEVSPPNRTPVRRCQRRPPGLG